MATLNEKKTAVVAQVVKLGEKLIIPVKMSPMQAIDTLTRFMQAQEEMVNVVRIYDAFPWDGAVALNDLIIEKYGWANVRSPSFFGKATMVPVEVGYKKTVQVPWGRFELPGTEGGTLTTGIGERHGRSCFQITATVRRKYEDDTAAFLDSVTERLTTHSIYRGKAIEIDFDQQNEENGLVEPKFLNVDVDPQSLILPGEVQDAVETEVFTPIIRHKELARHGISFRCCVMLAGMYGTGKTLTMTIAARHCTEQGILFLKVKRASQLAQAIEFTKMYQEPYGAVISGEDFDRVASGERSVTMDDLLNTVDGVDSKTSKIMVVLTTNAVEAINPAALRSGRVRQIINFTPPDAFAAERLVRYYGKGIVREDADLTEVREVLAGNIPATIADVVSSSKLAMLKRLPIGSTEMLVDGEALLEASRSKEMQTSLVNKKADQNVLPTVDQALRQIMGIAIQDEGVDGKTIIKLGDKVKYEGTGSSTLRFTAKS